MKNIATLSQFLLHSDKFPWDSAIYLPKGEVWTLNSAVAVLDPGDCEEGEDPNMATSNGLSYALGVGVCQDIVANAREQKEDCTVNDLFSAFMFYYENDAFIVLK